MPSATGRVPRQPRLRSSHTRSALSRKMAQKLDPIRRPRFRPPQRLVSISMAFPGVWALAHPIRQPFPAKSVKLPPCHNSWSASSLARQKATKEPACGSGLWQPRIDRSPPCPTTLSAKLAKATTKRLNAPGLPALTANAENAKMDGRLDHTIKTHLTYCNCITKITTKSTFFIIFSDHFH